MEADREATSFSMVSPEPQVFDVVWDATWTVYDAPAARSEGPQLRTPPEMAQSDGPLLKVQLTPLAEGRVSVSVAEFAVDPPVFVAVIVSPMLLPEATPEESGCSATPILGADGVGLYVYWSEEVALDVPPSPVVTVTSTDPGREVVGRFVVGDVTVMDVPVELTVNDLVSTPPKET